MKDGTARLMKSAGPARIRRAVPTSVMTGSRLHLLRSMVLIVGLLLTGTAQSQVPVRFAVIGDFGWAGPPAQDVSDLIHGWNPDFIITVGDNNYPIGEAATIDQNIGQYYHDFIFPYKGVYGPGASVNRFFPSLGNHDWFTPDAQAYLDYFTLPGNGRYYDVLHGPVHLFALDSDGKEPDGTTDTSVQGLWLKAKLSASTAKWKLVFMHHPPFSSGINPLHGQLQWPFEAWGATAVLAGHDHDYERFAFGIPYFVIGVSGAPNLSAFQDTPTPGSAVRFTGDFGAMLVEATDDHIMFTFMLRDGSLIDTLTLPTQLTLSATRVGNGRGTIVSTPAGTDPTGIACGVACTTAATSYPSGTSVTLTATAASDSVFTGWSGGGCSGAGPCAVTITKNLNVFATFTARAYVLTVDKAGNGSGTVRSDPAGVNCGVGCATAVAGFSSGTLVTLAAAPAAGSTFKGWSGFGGGCGGTEPCTVTITGNRRVSATFVARAYALSVEKAGTGGGIVTTAPAGISCDVTCVSATAAYGSGTLVTLTAIPLAGSVFTGWSGGGSSCIGTGTCSVAVTRNTNVFATFAAKTYQLSVVIKGSGSANGAVLSSPLGIDCPHVCSADFTPGVFARLTPVSAAGTSFAGWSGACSQAQGDCAVTMGAAQSVVALFAGSPREFNGSFTDDPLVGKVVVKAVHVMELRDAIDSLRVGSGLAPVFWSDPSPVPKVTPQRAAHVNELRAALAEVYEVRGLTPPVFADTPLASMHSPVLAVHLNQLRSAVRALP